MEKKIISLDVPTLWASYMNNSMAICVQKYALKTIIHPKIKTIFEKALDLAVKNLEKVTQLFTSEEFPIPLGFSDEDLNLEAPSLFSDEFWLFYLHEMTINGLTAYSLGLTTSQRTDIRHFYSDNIKEAFKLSNLSLETMKSLGILEREPTIMVPAKVEFAKKQSFMAGWFGDHRPLNVIEVNSLFFNLTKSSLTKTLCIGFSQTAQSEEVRSFLKRTITVADKHISLFSSKLEKDSINTTVSWDSHVTDSKISPFSDKLMMFHCSFLIQAAITYYGTAMASSMRKDLGLSYATAVTEDARLAEDGMNIMIENGWFEQPPHSIDRYEMQ